MAGVNKNLPDYARTIPGADQPVGQEFGEGGPDALVSGSVAAISVNVDTFARHQEPIDERGVVVDVSEVGVEQVAGE
tara:strand:+ start:301 stop:531 length:231 start_codon:yes stop_codon:yes gene_type:complete